MRRSPASKRKLALWLLSLLVAASMICSLVVMIRPSAPEHTPSPTAPPQAPTMTPAPSPVPTQHALTAAPPTRRPGATPTASPTFTLTPSPTWERPPTEEADRGERVFTFAVCGDSRGGEAIYRRILEGVQKDGCAFLIHTGDLVNSGTEAQFKEFARLMSDFKLPFYPVPGNHDNPDGHLTAYLKYSGAPAAHYAFDYGSVHFSLIDTSSGDASAEELAWLAKDLEATKQPVKVVVLHHPPFDPAGTDHIMRHGNKEFMELMAQKGVKLVLAGHIHSYDEQVRDGVRYVITGGAGAPLYPEANRPAFHHYLRIRVQGEELDIEVVRVTP